MIVWKKMIPKGSVTVRRCDFVRVAVALLEEVCHCRGRLWVTSSISVHLLSTRYRTLSTSTMCNLGLAQTLCILSQSLNPHVIHHLWFLQAFYLLLQWYTSFGRKECEVGVCVSFKAEHSIFSYSLQLVRGHFVNHHLLQIEDSQMKT